jgi:DNA polymerase-1
MSRYILDIETDNLLDKVTTIHCVVLREVGHLTSALTYYRDNLKNCIERIELADEIIGHNVLAYDLPVLEKLWGFKYEGKVTDTLVCSRTIWPNLGEIDQSQKKLNQKLWGSHSLKAWGYRLNEHKGEFNDGNPDSFKTFSMDMLHYCVQDTLVTDKLFALIESKAFSEDALNLEHELAYQLFKQEQRGFEFNVESARELYSKLAQRKNEIELDLVETFEPTIVELKTKTKIIPFNPASRLQIADRLMKRGWKPKEFTPSGEAKVDEAVLQTIEMPEAKLLLEYLMLNKRIGQLATGNQAWLKLEKNGKLHGRVNHMGAVTSRCTHSNPNMAQVPSVGAPFGAECRGLFTVPHGYSLLGADASGLELRCLAHYMARYDGGAYGREILEGDIHTANQEAAGLPTRNDAKRFIYGFLYGAGDEKVGEIIGKGSKEGKAIKTKFLSKTPALKKLRDAVSRSAERGWIKGLDGRRIPIRHAHAALNTLLQSAGAIICKRWYVTVEKKLRANSYTEEDVAIVAFIHDELQIQVRKGLEDEVGLLVQEAMKDTEHYYDFKCPLDSEYKYGDNWADTH